MRSDHIKTAQKSEGKDFILPPFSRDVTTNKPEAKSWVEDGLVNCYSFNHAEAERCFEKAINIDSECALAFFGVAYSLGPNYNKPWKAFDRNDLRHTTLKGIEACKKAESLASKASPVERALIGAIRHRYPKDENDTDNAKVWNEAYAEAMRPVYKEFKDDLDVATLYADALMNLTPWALWDVRTGKPAPGSEVIEIQEVIERGLAQDGGYEHVGLLHAYIHVTEMSTEPEKGLVAAEHLRRLANEAGHLAHMPSHLDILIGDYRRAISANTKAIMADEKFLSLRGGRDFYTIYRMHDYHSLIYAAMFAGQYAVSMEAVERMELAIPDEDLRIQSPPMADWLETFRSVRPHILIRFGKWEEIIETPLPLDQELLCVTTATIHYAKGVAYAALGNVDESAKQRELFLAAKARVPPTRIAYPNSCAAVLNVAEAMLDGELEYRRGNIEVAFEHLRTSIERDDSLRYAEPWAWMQPARHAYAALLMEQERIEEAAEVYRTDLGLNNKLFRARHHPNNVWALHGYHECAVKLGLDGEARVIKQQLKTAMAFVDVPIESSCYCRRDVKNANGCCHFVVQIESSPAYYSNTRRLKTWPHSFPLILHLPTPTSTINPHNAAPREEGSLVTKHSQYVDNALQDQNIARLFHSYTSDISKWYDLSDSLSSFGQIVPTLALDEELLFSAIIALSAMHTCKTSSPSFLKVAEFYHHRCVRLLITLREGDQLITRGLALAATCLLRSFEILQGVGPDPNMHLRGAYSMASLHDVLSGNLQAGLLGAGFWNYLREDITFSLFEKCPLKMNLDSTPLVTYHESGQDYLNSITLILGKSINMAYSQDTAILHWKNLTESLKDWRKACPDHMRPFSRQTSTSHLFPAVWFLQPYHAAILHYYLVTMTFICLYGQSEALDDMDILDLEADSKEQILEKFAIEICGIAFTAKIPSVLNHPYTHKAHIMLRTQKIFPAFARCARSFATAAHSLQPGVVQPSSREVKNLTLDSRNLEKAVRHMHRDGLVIVEDVVPHHDIDLLNKKMIEDAHVLQARGDKGPFNYNKGNIQQDAPPVAEYFKSSIFTNPIATQITTAMMGPRPKWTFCSANSAMATLPGGTPERQPVHSDADFAHPDHPFALVVNIPLVKTTPENGSTEIWLGTHNRFGLDAQEGAHGERASGRIREDFLRRREEVSPPIQPIIKKGSIIVRDLRLWHAGMPNLTEQTRVMLAMIHFAPWYRNRMRLELGEDVKPILEGLEREGKLGLDVPVNWASREAVLEGYLNRGFGNSYDFSQEA
ncbi:putative tpr domain [Fusarium sporotrichioides]|uniref:Putative tpr domain n=1 Tax=Fusarium sporotrichioides TaxID=5514 RepID=A0A395S5A6_FUSSP|nr:putative tpr domain [Fusarium sporotrichioides]